MLNNFNFGYHWHFVSHCANKCIYVLILEKVKCASPSSNPLFWCLGILAWLLFGWMPSLRLAVRTWKLMVGRRSFHFGFRPNIHLLYNSWIFSKPPKTISEKKIILSFFLFMGVFLRGSRSLDFLVRGVIRRLGGPPLAHVVGHLEA